MIAWFIDWSIDWLIEVCPGLQITYQNVMCGSSGVPCSTSMHVYAYNTTFQFLRGVGLIVNNKIIGMDTAWSMANGVVQIYPSTSSIAMFMRDEEVMILWSDSKWGQLPFLPCYLSHRIFFFLIFFFACLGSKYCISEQISKWLLIWHRPWCILRGYNTKVIIQTASCLYRCCPVLRENNFQSLHKSLQSTSCTSSPRKQINIHEKFFMFVHISFYLC